MSKGSKQIIREGRKHGLSESASQHSFLQRNFYRQKGKRADSRITDKPNMTSRLKSQKSRRDLSKLNDYVRDISGSKISFLNYTWKLQLKGLQPEKIWKKGRCKIELEKKTNNKFQK